MKQKRRSPSGAEALSAGVTSVEGPRIFAHSPVSLEHQHLAKRYVVRGLESVARSETWGDT